MTTEYTDRDYLRDRIWDAERDKRLAVFAGDKKRLAAARRTLKILWRERDEEFRIALKKCPRG